MIENKFYEEFEDVIDEAVEDIFSDVMGGFSLLEMARDNDIDALEGEFTQLVIDWVDNEHIDLIDAVSIFESADYVTPHESDVLTRTTPKEALILQAQDTLHASIWDAISSKFDDIKQDTMDDLDDRIEELEDSINNSEGTASEEQNELNELFDLWDAIDRTDII